MKQVKKWLWGVLMAVAICSLLIPPMSISSVAEEQQVDVSIEELNKGLETPGVLRVGMEANYAPFNWSQPQEGNNTVPIQNSKGEYANGYDVQMAKKLADSLGLELEIVKVEWDGLPPALASGKVDAIIAGMTATPERKKQVDFTENYYDSQMVIVVEKDGEFAKASSIKDFAEARITAQLNTFHVDLIDQIPDVKKQTPMDSFPTMISALLANKVDGYISEEPGAMAAVAANPSLEYIEFDEGKGFDLEGIDTGIAIGLRKNSNLTPIFNEALDLISEEERQEIMEEMVDLNLRQEDSSFWTDVKNLWDAYGTQFYNGAKNTMFIALISTFIGSLIGLLVALIRSTKVNKKKHPLGYFFYKLVDYILVAYVEIFRGTPMMVQAMLIFYGMKLFFDIDLTSMTAALVIVSINTGAYLAEVFRGGIQGVDDGQVEAAHSVGMNHVQAMVYVVLPQAIISTLPTLGNEFVINIKDTSVLNVIAVTELFFVTRSAAGSTYLTFQAFFITSVIYFVLTFVTTRILNYLEKKLAGPESYELYEANENVEGA